LPRFSAESAPSLSCDIADDLLLGICVGINSHIVRCTERLGIWLVRARKRIRVVRAIGAHILKGGYEGCYSSALFLQGYNAGASNSCKGESRLRSTKTTVRVVAESVPDPTVVLTGPDRFTRFSVYSSRCLGSRWAFLSAIAVIAVWAFTGSLFHYSDPWQLVINTGTTIVTFLMVFIIQNTQNRDARAIHLKLNELIHAIDKAKNKMIDVESLSDCELEELAKTYETIRRSAQDRQASRQVLK
jgi:low affinity Fe/Cu permease